MNKKWLCVLVIIVALSVIIGGCQKGADKGRVSGGNSSAEAVDLSKLKSSDGQPLLIVDDSTLDIPARPANPDALPEDNPLHWYDREYAGRNTQKVNQPKSPGDGPRGKKVLCLLAFDHPYFTAYSNGMKKVADAYGINLKTMVANNDMNIQSQQIDQAINEKPDMVIIVPVDATAVAPLLRRLNQAAIPVIASNLLPSEEGMKYILTWTGPDDWGQFRMLSHKFAELMNNEGGYCIIQHMPGSSNYFARTYSAVSELKKIAPKMKLLHMQTTDLKAEKSMQVVSDWITRFGPQLKGIIAADDAAPMIGVNQAAANAHRTDLITVAAGNSKIGMNFIKNGKLNASTYQSAESDGALPMKITADWFSGKPIEKPVYYLPKKIITKENVDQYMPAQW